jgi:hypothetical protein
MDTFLGVIFGILSVGVYYIYTISNEESGIYAMLYHTKPVVMIVSTKLEGGFELGPNDYLAATVSELPITRTSDVEQGSERMFADVLYKFAESTFVGRTSQLVRYYLGDHGNDIPFEVDHNVRSYRGYNTRWMSRFLHKRQHDGLVYLIPSAESSSSPTLNAHCEGLAYALGNHRVMRDVPVLICIGGVKERSEDTLQQLNLALKLSNYAGINPITVYFPDAKDHAQETQKIELYYKKLIGIYAIKSVHSIFSRENKSDK